MALLILSFLAGILTVAAPCILPLLPIIVGGSIERSEHEDSSKQWLRPLVIVLSLSVSIVVFTLLLKGTTALLGVPQIVWQVFSGTIITLLGIHFIKPNLWEYVPLINRLNLLSNQALGSGARTKSLRGDMLVGAALGPVFNSCSPTYALVVATVLPASFAKGILYLAAYVLGLAGTLLLIGYAGQSVAAKLGWINDPKHRLRLWIGIVFIAVGLFVLFGLDKRVQTYVIGQGWYDPVSRLERSLK